MRRFLRRADEGVDFLLRQKFPIASMRRVGDFQEMLFNRTGVLLHEANVQLDQGGFGGGANEGPAAGDEMVFFEEGGGGALLR